MVQDEPLQFALPVAPLVGPGHAAVHDVPQLLATDGAEHLPLQEISGALHTHVPLPPHCAGDVQALHMYPPVPQLALLWLAYGSQAVALLQQPVQPLVVLHEHWPFEHWVPAPHGVPQVPQLLSLVSRLTHAVGLVAGQAVKPDVLQVILQTPALQPAVAPATLVVQACPHVPQLALSVCVLVHTPDAGQ